MQTSYFAHSGSSPNDTLDWHPLHQHLSQVSELAAERAQVFGGEDWARLAGILHDLGKYSDEFQERLRGSLKRTDHATVGAKIAVQHVYQTEKSQGIRRSELTLLAKAVAFAIAGHHAGLANGVEEGTNRSTLKQRLSLKCGKGIPEISSDWEKELVLPSTFSIPALKPHSPSGKYKNFGLAFFTRMIFSCLIDADRIDTENYVRRLSKKPPLKNNSEAISLLQFELDQHLAQLAKDASNTPVNALRQQILTHVKRQANLAPGLFSMTVPTGGGKTLTSLAFGLDHAVRHGLRRVIYVAPFTSVIEQTANVFRGALGKYGENILEHHSSFDRDKLIGNSENVGFNRGASYRDKLHMAMENWDAPVVVTTAVQFFESLFSDRPSQCRKLHNIAGSVIVLDEAQTLPLTLLRPIMAVLEELTLNYGCSLVLCTATQPALNQSDNFHNGFQNVREVAPNPPELFEKLRRVKINFMGEQNDAQLASLLRDSSQVLMIVNNKRHARSLFDAIADEPGACHLTTSMCAEHRSQTLIEIRKRLSKGSPCRLVATSLIEAGVDVDFPKVYRAEAGLDSIAQAAGRCNREGRHSPDESHVFVFQSPEWKAPTELAQLTAPMRSVLRTHKGDVLAPDALKSYFRQVFTSKSAELDKHSLLKNIAETEEGDFSFQTIGKRFRMIESVTLPIIISFNAEAKDSLFSLENLPKNDSVGKIARKLQRYVVQVPEKTFIQLLGSKDIEAIKPERFGVQFYALKNESLYSRTAGFNFFDPTGPSKDVIL